MEGRKEEKKEIGSTIREEGGGNKGIKIKDAERKRRKNWRTK